MPHATDDEWKVCDTITRSSKYQARYKAGYYSIWNLQAREMMTFWLVLCLYY
jgi:hypothetical protein